MNLKIVSFAMLAVFGFGGASSAGVFHDLNDDRYEVLGDQFQGQALWVEADGPGGRQLRGTAVRLNDHFGLTAAHLFTDGGGAFTDFVVGNGENYFSDQGEVRTIVDFGLHPSWDGTFSNGSTDLAWIQFDSPLAGDDLTIGDALLGENITFVGYGDPALAGQATLPADGERRGFTAPITEYGFSAFGVDDLYSRSRFRVPQISGALGGKGNDGDSGSLGIDANGELDLLLVGGTVGNEYGTSTFGVRLGLYRDWIEENTAMPEPGSAVLLAIASLSLALRRVRQ